MTSSKKERVVAEPRRRSQSKGLVTRTGTRVPERRRKTWLRTRPPRRTSTPALPSLWLTTPRLWSFARRRSTRLSAMPLVLVRPRWTRRSLTSVRAFSQLCGRRMLPLPTRRWLRSLASLLRRWALLFVTLSRRSVSPALRVRRRAPLRPLRLSANLTFSARGVAGLVHPNC